MYIYIHEWYSDKHSRAEFGAGVFRPRGILFEERVESAGGDLLTRYLRRDS